MAQHPIWRGQLRLALVSCPVALYTAHHERGSLHFNMINPKTGNRIRQLTVDAETEEEVTRADLAKGYEFERDTYLLLTDEDFESARTESSSVIKIAKFVERASIDPIYFDASYYMAPDGEGGEDVYAVLRDAIAATDRMALARVVIARRERPIGILPFGRGLVAHTLHAERELADPEPLFADIPKSAPDRDMIKLAQQLIERQAGRYEPADAEDRYETRLRAVIEAKLKGEGVAAPEEEETGNVIDLMAALKKSLAEGDGGSSGTRSAAKATPAKPAASKPTARKGGAAPKRGRRAG